MSVGKLTVLNRFLEIFAKKYGSSSPKIVEKKIAEAGGGLKALLNCPLKKDFFSGSISRVNPKPRQYFHGIPEYYHLVGFLPAGRHLPEHAMEQTLGLVCPNFGHPALTSSFTEYKFLQVKKSFAIFKW